MTGVFVTLASPPTPRLRLVEAEEVPFDGGTVRFAHYLTQVPGASARSAYHFRYVSSRRPAVGVSYQSCSFEEFQRRVLRDLSRDLV